MSKIYLATPYTGMENQAFKTVNEVAAKLLKEGEIVFSPISQCHPISTQCGLPQTFNFWAKLDHEFISWSDKVIMLEIGENGQELIKNSKGCQAELKFAKELNKPVEYFKV